MALGRGLIDVCRNYLRLRSTWHSEERVAAHNAVLDGLRSNGIYYNDREHAASIASALVLLYDAGVTMVVYKHKDVVGKENKHKIAGLKE